MKPTVKYFFACLLMWIIAIILLFGYASHLEAENEARDFPHDEIADELQLAEMQRYHEGNSQLLFFE